MKTIYYTILITLLLILGYGMNEFFKNQSYIQKECALKKGDLFYIENCIPY